MGASRIVRRAIVAAAVVGALAVAIGSASCAATPTPVPVRTFDRAQKVAFVCLQVNNDDMSGRPLSAVATASEAMCPPVAPYVLGANLAFHYFALVTQATRGELAVVDLTAGGIVDEDHSTPGVNFIPVGADPTDVAVAPVTDVSAPGFTYVASADPSSYALYAIDDKRLLGDSTGSPPPPPLQITDLMACALPERPIAIAIVSSGSAANGAGADGGLASDAGGVKCQAGYSIAVLLQAYGGLPSQVMMVDPNPLVCAQAPGAHPPGSLFPCVAAGGGSGTGLSGPFSAALAGASAAPGASWPDGVFYADAAAGPAGMTAANDAGDAAPNGSAGDAASGVGNATADAGDGSDDGGAAMGADAPFSSDLDASDAAADSEAGSLGSPAAADAAADAAPAHGAPSGAAAPSLSVGPLFDPQPMAMVVRDDAPVLYISDSAVPLIHVIDVSNPGSPVEVSSFVATSQVQPRRRVQIGAIALSPATSSFDPVTGRAVRYLYAIDKNDGSLMVYDATVPVPPPFTPPLVRPHSELNPFAPRDRLTFAAPVAAVTFVHHDWPLFPPNGSNSVVGYSGLICNPNPNTRTPAWTVMPPEPAKYGAYYAVDQAALIEPQGAGAQGFPQRLRGVFGFATLSNGNVVAIDVDDWDAPCRRPDPMDETHRTGVLDLPEQAPAGNMDLDPYHAPTAHGTSASYVTQEAFFPVSAPNRVRSSFLLRNDPTAGNHMPNLLSTPQLLSAAGAPVSGFGATEPIMLPTALQPGFVDPAYYLTPTDSNDNYGTSSSQLGSADAQAAATPDGGSSLFPGESATPALRVSLDDPTAHIDQDWVATYEGALPPASPIVANIDSTDGYQSLVLTVGGAAPDGGASAANARFCGLGIEDWAIGQSRANTALAAMKSLGLPVPSLGPSQALPRWTSDYIEITDDLLPRGDGYWNTDDETDAGHGCWYDTGLRSPSQADARYSLCAETFGPVGANADAHLARDFPIAEAYDGSLVIGRFGFPSGTPEQTSTRTVVGKDPSNVLFLEPAACCFHKQVHFKVRTGGEWVIVGQNGLGLLHHVVADPASGRCVPSTDPHDALLNARTFDVPFFDPATCSQASSAVAPIDRTSPLAMRNPMFSFLIWAGCSPPAIDQHTTTTRDLSWHFSMRGGFSPLTISLAGGTNLPIVPQSMAFATAFEQLAIVDGSFQGLILIDLNTLAFAHAPYF